MKKLLWGLLPLLLCAESISDKKMTLIQKNTSRDADVAYVNERLTVIKKSLQEAFVKAQALAVENGDETAYRQVLDQVKTLKKEKESLEEGWRELSAQEGGQDGEAFSLWDQEEIVLSQLVMEYGSPDYLYVIPPEYAGMKMHLYSNIPIPRQSWTDLLEMVLQQQGFGVKQINPYARQLYVLKQDLGTVHTVAYRPEHVGTVPAGKRICYLVVPPIEQVRSVFQFFEKFSDMRQTFVQQLGNKIAIVATKEEVEKLLDFYEKVYGRESGKTTKVISVSKIHVREMEKILSNFFSEALDKNRPPFAKPEQETISIFPLGNTNSLILIGSKESVDRAEKVIKETEDQLENPSEMTIYLYTCRHSDPNDLAQTLERVYISLLTANQDTAPKETDINYNSQVQGVKSPPEGYPPITPLVVQPALLKPGFSSQEVETQRTGSDHFIPDPKTGTILMTVRREVLGKIKELLKKLDIPKKMVQIEVLLFERQINSQDNFGLNLLKLGSRYNGVTYTSTLDKRMPMRGHGHPHKGGSENNKDIFKRGVMQFFFHGDSSKFFPKFDVAYNFLLTQDNIQLNAAPSVITVNQTPTKIAVVKEISINNGAAPVDTSKGTIAFEKSFARAQYGINIVLTPTIHSPEENEEVGAVTLKSNITFDTTKEHNDDRPEVDKRHLENEVRVIDGETVVLGGLRRKIQSDAEEKVPFLGDLPWIGRFFGTTQLTDHETELFFFITPKIIYDPKEQMEKIRTEDLKKRPGDIPEFLVKVDEAREKASQKFFKHSLKTFLTHDR